MQQTHSTTLATRAYFVYLTMAEVARHFLLPMLPLLYFHPHWLWQGTPSFADQAWHLGVGLALVKGGGMVSCVLAYWVLRRFGLYCGAWLSHLSVLLVALLGLLAMFERQVWYLQLGLLLHGILFCGEVSGLSYAQCCQDAQIRLKRLAHFQSYWCFGAMLGPLFAAFFLSSDAWVWWLWSAVLVVGLLGVLWGVGRAFRPSGASFSIRFSWLKSKGFWPLCIQLWWVQATWAMFYQFSPGLLVRYAHLSAKGIGLSMAALSLVLVATSGGLLPFVASRFKLKSLFTVSLIGLLLAPIALLLGLQLDRLFSGWALGGVLMAASDVVLFTLLLRQLIQCSVRDGIAVVCFVFFSCLVVWMACGLMGGYGFAQHLLFIPIWMLAQALFAIIWYGVWSKRWL